MSDPKKTIAAELSENLFGLLEKNMALVGKRTADELIQDAERHLRDAKAEAMNNSLVSPRLAEAILERFKQILARWEQVSEESKPWIMGALCYYSSEDDEIHDFSSPIGFDDDCDVLNACLKAAEMEELILDADDYGD